jgi:hypothetical protein
MLHPMDTEMLHGWAIEPDELSQLHPPPPRPDPADGSIVRVRGVTGDPVAVTGLDREPEAVVVERTRSWRASIRPRVVMAWAGAMLMALAGASGFAAAAWHAPSAAAMAGASGLFGLVSLLGATRR